METKLENKYVYSLENLVNNYEKKVYGFIYNIIRDHYMAQDLTQDVFVRIYQNLYKYNSDYPIEPWIFKIAYNLTINYFKKNKNKLTEVQLDEKMDTLCILEDNIVSIEIQESMLKTIKSFSPDCKAIFVLRIIEDLTFEQIAEILGTSTASAKLKFYRNRKTLISKLNGEV
jgi:RNA polymerase sigma-70 factor, ECF subfamily